jgi:hypothetical protein
VTVTREESKPQVVEIKVGEEVWFVKRVGWFDKPGTYDYTVHMSGVKPTHTPERWW